MNLCYKKWGLNGRYVSTLLTLIAVFRIAIEEKNSNAIQISPAEFKNNENSVLCTTNLTVSMNVSILVRTKHFKRNLASRTTVMHSSASLWNERIQCLRSSGRCLESLCRENDLKPMRNEAKQSRSPTASRIPLQVMPYFSQMKTKRCL